MELALHLDALNRDRQQKTAEAVRMATDMIGDREPPALVMIGHQAFSSGIVGLIAAKLVTLYGRPAVVYEIGETTSRASCRSIDEFHITDALRSNASLFVRFGGHRAAAGFTAENDRIDDVRSHLIAEAERALAGRELAPVLEIDCNLPLRNLRGDELRWLTKVGPFGIGNPAPAFLARNVVVTETKWLANGDKHRRLKLRDGMTVWPAVAFDMGEVPVATGDAVDVVYTVEVSPSGMAELRVEDLRPAERPAADAP
jgi:single-stranded-DNA-specific exonuclease